MILGRLSRQTRYRRKHRRDRKRQHLIGIVARSPRLESLEDRRVLAAGVVDLPATGGEFLLTRQAEDVIVIADPSGDPIEIFRESFESLESLQVNGSAGDDRLRVELDHDDLIPLGGLHFSGGDQATPTGDTLSLEGGTFSNAAFGYLNANSGTIGLDDLAITYSGLEPITSTVTASDVVLTYLGADETITVSGSAGQTTVSSTLGEVTTFNHPSNSLTIESLSGTDIVNVQGVGTGFSANFQVNAQADDTVRFQTTNVDLGSGDLSVNAGNIGVAVDVSSTGNQTYNGIVTTTSDATLFGTEIDINAGVALQSANLTIDTTDIGSAISGVIAGTGDLIKQNTGTLSLTNDANTYTGSTVINGGTLSLVSSTSNNIENSAVIRIQSGTLDVLQLLGSGLDM